MLSLSVTFDANFYAMCRHILDIQENSLEQLYNKLLVLCHYKVVIFIVEVYVYCKAEVISKLKFGG